MFSSLPFRPHPAKQSSIRLSSHLPSSCTSSQIVYASWWSQFLATRPASRIAPGRKLLSAALTASRTKTSALLCARTSKSSMRALATTVRAGRCMLPISRVSKRQSRHCRVLSVFWFTLTALDSLVRDKHIPTGINRLSPRYLTQVARS